MVVAMVVMALLTLVGGGVYADALSKSPLTRDVWGFALLGAVVASMLWVAFAAILGNQQKIERDLQLVKTALGARETTEPEPARRAESRQAAPPQ